MTGPEPRRYEPEHDWTEAEQRAWLLGYCAAIERRLGRRLAGGEGPLTWDGGPLTPDDGPPEEPPTSPGRPRAA